MWVMEVFVAIEVKVLSSTAKGTAAHKRRNSSKKTAKILTHAYVRQLNQGISYRIQQREMSHAEGMDVAAKARFR